MSQQDNEILTQALEYYRKRVSKQRGIEALEETKAGSELITEDNLKIDKDIEETLKYLITGSSVRQVVTPEPRRQVICDALNAYELGLKETRETYWKEVGAHPKLKSTDDAISLTQNLKREFCSGR